MVIYLGTDHAGYALKEKIKEQLIAWGYEVQDKGAFSYQPRDDYPDYIAAAAAAVSAGPADSKGIVFGHSGQGEAIVANKYEKVRAVVYYGGPEDIIKLSREHNNANVLSLGAAFLDDKTAASMVKLWLETPFSRERRHQRRLDLISDLERRLRVTEVRNE